MRCCINFLSVSIILRLTPICGCDVMDIEDMGFREINTDPIVDSNFRLMKFSVNS